jgi:hypothetical protein
MQGFVLLIQFLFKLFVLVSQLLVLDRHLSHPLLKLFNISLFMHVLELGKT